ncbi:MAG: hypothetical protein HFI93_02370 [Lachnospiraceae bacterium]|nr:hypothetical protein [Lachnospiraceae bacterium]
MRVVVNDLAFCFPFYEKAKLMEAIRKLIFICKELESVRCHKVDTVVRIHLDKSKELAPGYSIYRVVQEIKDRNEKTYFLSLLANKGVAFPCPAHSFIYKDRDRGCAPGPGKRQWSVWNQRKG